MSVVAAYLYREGKRVEEVHLDRPMPHMVGHGEFVWIGLLEPTEDELRSLQQNFGLHPLAVEDALQPPGRHGGAVGVRLRALHHDARGASRGASFARVAE